MARSLTCAKTGKTSYDGEGDDTIVELHFGCGHIEFLCLEARRDWSHQHAHHELTRKAEILNAKIWAIRALIRKGNDHTDQLIKLIGEMQEVEKKIFDYAAAWLKIPLEIDDDE